jgi:transcriptional regulator with GAF, ATPase, and Fis domain
MDARGGSSEGGTDDTLEVRRATPSGPWVLEVGSPEGGHAMLLRNGDRVVLGSGRNADLRVEDPAVSQRHCQLRAHAGHVEIEDLGSKNGVYTGAVRVGSASVVDCGAFVIGRTSIVLRCGLDEDVPCADPVPGLVGGSLGVRRVAAEVRRHARTRAPILLQGESGTGKDVVARGLHQLSQRTGAYLPLNVGALPESLADAELFGHRRGAFTGALHSRPGAFEQADSGTLFLDEIADLPLAIQIKLLRVVEDGSVRPLGASSPLRVDVRIVSASWAMLEERVEKGSFRADLYHRLSTVVIQIPPLRQRKSDIPELSRALLRRIREEVGEKQLTSGALSRLVSYEWPGNVRELGSVLYRAAMSSTPAREIQAEHVQLSAARAAPRLAALGAHDATGLLREHHGNVSAAARAAGVPRSTFRAWLARPAHECAEPYQERTLGASSR